MKAVEMFFFNEGLVPSLAAGFAAVLEISWERMLVVLRKGHSAAQPEPAGCMRTWHTLFLLELASPVPCSSMSPLYDLL